MPNVGPLARNSRVSIFAFMYLAHTNKNCENVVDASNINCKSENNIAVSRVLSIKGRPYLKNSIILIPLLY